MLNRLRWRNECTMGLVLMPLLVTASIFCSPGAQGNETAVVRHVIDGDTIVLSTGEKVRYLGINAPKIPHEEESGEPLGWEATTRNRSLVSRKLVRLEGDTESRDQFGRRLAYVFLQDGRLVNEILVREGLAYVCVSHRGLRHGERLLETQRDAIEAGRGLWAIATARPEPFYVGNLRSLRFHRPGCPFGQQIAKTNRLTFRTIKEAYSSGYCRCKKCCP